MPQNHLARPVRNAFALAAIAFFHGLVFMAMLPHWMGEDEPWHVQNAVMVARGHGGPSSFKFGHEAQRIAPLSHLQVKRAFGDSQLDEIAEVEDGILASMRDKGVWRRVDWTGRDDTIESFDEFMVGITAAHQPRLYYFLCAPLLNLFPEAEPRFQVLWLRCFSLLIFVGTVLLAYAAAFRVFPRGPGALLAGLLVALWPMSARGAAVVNNDVLTRFWIALALFLAAYWVTRKEPKRGEWWLHAWPPLALILVSALAVWTKTSGASAVAIAFLAILLHPAALRRIRGTALALLGLGAVVVGGAATWLASHNPGITRDLSANLERLRSGVGTEQLLELRSTLIGRFNWEDRSLQPDLGPLIGMIALVLLAISLFALFWRRDWLRSRLIWLAWGATFVQLFLMAMRGVSKGRYLMPIAPALAILLVAGLLVLLPKRFHRHAAFSMVMALVLFDGFFVWHGLGRAAWLEWRY